MHQGGQWRKWGTGSRERSNYLDNNKKFVGILCDLPVRDDAGFKGLREGQAWPDKQLGSPQLVWKCVLVQK